MKKHSAKLGIPLSRLLRIFLSVTVCVIAAPILSSLLWIELEGHYTYRAAAPFFALSFLSLFALGYVILFFGLFVLGEWAARRFGPLSSKQSLVLVGALVIGSLTGFLNFWFGSFFLFLLFYWLMTGRVAGRPGWSTVHFLRTKWDEQLYLVATVLLFTPMIYGLISLLVQYALPASPGTPLFQVKYSHQMNADVERALRRFPDMQACLQPGADASKREDLLLLDWDRIVTTGDATVCSFRLLHGWGGVADAAEWLKAQELQVGQSFSSEEPYLGIDGTHRVDGHWSIKRNGPRFPTTGVVRRVLSATAYGMGLRATYSPDGDELLYLEIDYSTL